jgi:predicted ATPase
MAALNLFVITGGPGSGKSTLVSALQGRGFTTVDESGRAIIREELAAGGDALPWGDRARFAQRMLDLEIDNHARMRESTVPVIFDRGIPDVIGYLRLCDLPVPDAADTAARARRYSPLVFIAPHWPTIYAQDAERKQDAEEAERTYLMMRSVYAEYGYELAELPLASVEERVDFVLARIRA